MFLGLVDDVTYEQYQAFKAFESISKCFGSSSIQYEKTLINQGPTNNIRMEIYSKNGLPIIAYWIPEDLDNTVKNFADVDLFVEDILGSEFRFRDILSEDPPERVSTVRTGNDLQFNNLPISDYPFILYTE